MGTDDTVQEMDAQIARAKFTSVLQSTIMTCVTEAPTVWKGPNGKEYVYEQSLFEKNTKPVIWGIGCAMITFFSFRLNASRTFQQFRRRYIRQSAAPAPAAPIMKASSPADQRKDLQQEMMSQALSVPVDLLISIVIGASATAFLIDWRQVQRDLERAPGLPGRSVLADTMCPDMLQLYQNTPSRTWETSQTDETLKSFQTIVQNCKRRAKVQAAERQRLGLPDDQAVAIPFPGFV